MSSDSRDSLNIYREKKEVIKSSEETETTSSSSTSSEDSQEVLGVLTSASSEYFIQSYLGEGTFGEVAKCIKASTRETVAVKIMKDSTMTLDSQNEMAMLEYLKGFDSDKYNYVTYKEGFTDQNHICLEFEMLDISLLNFVQRKPAHCLALKEIRPILYQLATTLDFLKSHGLIHSDLKPDNIMLVDHVNQPLKVKVIDFGLARHASQSRSGSYLQTRYYRSPEVIVGSPHTAAIDVWSLGCIAAEMFLGYVLYPGHCEYDMLQHIVRTQGQPPVRLLNNGLKTSWFFRRRRCRQRRWRLKTPFEYGRICTDNYFNCLDDLGKVRPACHLSKEDNMAEIEDRENFVYLLKKMLHLDASKRILPSQIFEEPFITMDDLADSFPDGLYLKSSCKMMEVCQDHNVKSENEDKQPQLSPQPTTSTASPDQHVTHKAHPVWQSHEEHPLILGIASAISSHLTVDRDSSVSPPQQVSFSVVEKRTQPEVQLSGTSDRVHRRKKPRNTTSSQSDKSIKRALPEEKREKMDFFFFKNFKGMLTCSSTGHLRRFLIKAVATKGQRRGGVAPLIEKKKNRKARVRNLLHDGGQAQSEDLTGTAQISTERKLMSPTFKAAHGDSKSQGGSLQEKTKMTMSPGGVETFKELTENCEEAPTEATSNAPKTNLQRKRTWDTFMASHITSYRSPDSSSPKRKRFRMSLLQDSNETPSEAQSSEAKVTPRRKRNSATFTASHSASYRSPDSSSPERKRMTMSLPQNSNEAPTEAQSSEAKVTPRRKRSRATFTASHSASGTSPDSSSPERKRMKMTLPHEPNEAPLEAKASEAKVNSRRKRSWATFTASHSASCRSPDTSSPERKRTKMTLLQDSNEAPLEAKASEMHKDAHKDRKKDKSLAKNQR